MGDRITIRNLIIILFFLFGRSQAADHQLVTIRVDLAHPLKTFPPVWNFFGYDEPNYTYAANGKKLLREMAALSPTPAYIRVHNLLTTGDGHLP